MVFPAHAGMIPNRHGNVHARVGVPRREERDVCPAG